jgi:hypothetical protein
MSWRSLTIVAAGACAASCGGCLGLPAGGGNDRRPTIEQTMARTDVEVLRGQLRAFADRYMARIEEATDHIVFNTDDPNIRSAAHETKYYTSLSIVSLAGEPNPQSALIDMMVMTGLERRAWQQPWAADFMGEHAETLRTAQRDVEEDIWSIGAMYLNTRQRRDLASLLDAWLETNPERKYMSRVRLDDFSEIRGAAELQRDLRVGGFLAPIQEATAAVEQTRQLGDRALFLLERMPLLLSWQVETTVYDLVRTPEFRASMHQSERLVVTAERLADFTERVPTLVASERQAVTGWIEQRQADAGDTISMMRELLADAAAVVEAVQAAAEAGEMVVLRTRETAEALRATVDAADAVLGRFGGATEGAAPTRPFDIRDYTHAATELTVAIRELQELVVTTDGFLQSPGWTARLAEVNRAAADRVDHATEQGQQWVDHVFYRVVVVLLLSCLLAFLTMLAYRFTLSRCGLARGSA